MEDQTTVLEIVRQNVGTEDPGSHKGHFYVIGKCPIYGRTVYLTKDGRLDNCCLDGWFQDVREIATALNKYHASR